MSPLVSLVVLSDRPKLLPILLHALRAQTCESWEALVLDQSLDGDPTIVAAAMQDPRITAYRVERHGDWGQTAKAGAIPLTRGLFLGFPNDDAYYAPRYIESLLEASLRHSWDLVYCDWVFDQHGYRVMEGRPQVGHIDVGGFLVRRSVFERGIEWAFRGQTGDGVLVESIVSAGHAHGKAPGVLYVKN